MIATVWDVAAEHIVTFALGVLVGFWATSRYRIVKRKEAE